MKKFLLKIALCATALLAVGGVATPLFVSAEETQKKAIKTGIVHRQANHFMAQTHRSFVLALCL